MDSLDEFEGWKVKRVQSQFFLKDLPSRDGEYWYRVAGLRAKRGSVVLFQLVMSELKRNEVENWYR
jgi:hypothetical protein